MGSDGSVLMVMLNTGIMELFVTVIIYVITNRLLAVETGKRRALFLLIFIDIFVINMVMSYIRYTDVNVEGQDIAMFFGKIAAILLLEGGIKIISGRDYLHIFLSTMVTDVMGIVVVILPYALISSAFGNDFAEFMQNGPSTLQINVLFIASIIIAILIYVIDRLLKKYASNFVNTKLNKLWWIIIFMALGVATSGYLNKDILRIEVMLVYYAITIGISVLILYEISLFVRKRQEKIVRQENRILSVENAVMKEYYSTLEYQLDYTRKFRHDIEKHMAVIKEMITNQDDGKNLIEYTSQIQARYEGIVLDEYCKNPIINAILVNKKKQCNEKGIRFEILVDTFELGRIREIDIIAVLANVLDNAIEECDRIAEEDKKIKLKSYVSEGKLILNVCNSTDKREISNEFKTEKEDSYGHGVGLSIVKEVVEKYNGTFENSLEDDVYKVIIMLKLECK